MQRLVTYMLLLLFNLALSAALNPPNKKRLVLPPIGNKCRQFCTSLVQNLYYILDSYFRSEGVVFFE
jgi:hypothetical protein